MSGEYISIPVTEEEKASWTVKSTWASGEVLCECISISNSEKILTPKGKSKPTFACSFVMKLVEIDTGEEITCYLKHQKSKKGNATVKSNSKFAKLYRLTTGDNPRKRYSYAKQLAKHFNGKRFLVEYEITKTQQNESYRKAINIKPASPIITDEWTINGVLLGKTRARKSANNRGSIEDELRDNRGNIEDLLRIENAEESHFNLASPDISTAYQSIRAIGQGGIRAGSTVVLGMLDNKYITKPSSIDASLSYKTIIRRVSPLEMMHQYHQRPDESEEQYHDRVIAESFN